MSELAWTRVGSTWKADVYRIELDRPGRWVLIDEADESATKVETDLPSSGSQSPSRHYGGSLRRLKAVAENLEIAKHEAALRARYLKVAAAGVLLAFLALTSPDAVSLWTAFGLIAAVLYLLTKISDLRFGRRWDTIYEKYQ